MCVALALEKIDKMEEDLHFTEIQHPPVSGTLVDYKMVMVVSETTNNTLSTGTMVLILVGVVKGVFICFALMAVCYRYSSKKIKFLSGFDQRLSLSSNSWLAG